MRRGQKLITSEGNSLSVKAADGLGEATPFAIGPGRNLAIFAGGRRRFVEGSAVLQLMRKGEAKAVYDATVPQEEQVVSQQT